MYIDVARLNFVQAANFSDERSWIKYMVRIELLENAHEELPLGGRQRLDNKPFIRRKEKKGSTTMQVIMDN